MNLFLIFILLKIVISTPSQIPLSTSSTTSEFVFIVSIDGLRADYITRADELGLNIPNLKYLSSQGTSTRVKSVYPALTFPAHTTMITGVHPSKHGIYANDKFDPQNQGKGLFMFAEDVKVDTIFDIAHNHGLSTSAISWPLTAFSPSIDYSLPDAPSRSPVELDYYFNGCIKSSLFQSILDTRSKLLDINDGFRVYLLSSLLSHLQNSSYSSTSTASGTSSNNIPRLNALHLVDFDHAQHVYGAYSNEALRMLEIEDEHIGKILKDIQDAGIQDTTNLFILSDHGFTNITHQVSPTVLMSSMGLLYDSLVPGGWKAAPYVSPGTFAIYVNPALKMEDRVRTEHGVDELLRYFQERRYLFGLSRIVRGYDQVEKLNGFSGAYAVMECKPGYWFTTKTSGLLLVDALVPGYLGTHGYNPDFEEMKAVFIAKGPRIKKNKTIKQINMVDIAPTVATLLNMEKGNMEGRVLYEIFQ